jgi:hypothetical protein
LQATAHPTGVSGWILTNNYALFPGLVLQTGSTIQVQVAGKCAA